MYGKKELERNKNTLKGKNSRENRLELISYENLKASGVKTANKSCKKSVTGSFIKNLKTGNLIKSFEKLSSLQVSLSGQKLLQVP